jgi:transcriptional regulator with XRE-family HTH domain
MLINTDHNRAVVVVDTLTRNANYLLEFMGKSQTGLAAALGVSQSYVSMILTGKRQWQLEMLDPLAAFFSVSVPMLLIEHVEGFDRRRGERRMGIERRRRERRKRLSRDEEARMERLRTIARAKGHKEENESEA